MSPLDKDKVSTGGCIAALVLIPMAGVLNFVATITIWNWYVVGWLGVPSMSAHSAVGVWLLVGLFRQTSPTKDKRDEAELIGRLVGHVASPLLALAFGWACLGLR